MTHTPIKLYISIGGFYRGSIWGFKVRSSAACFVAKPAPGEDKSRLDASTDSARSFLNG